MSNESNFIPLVSLQVQQLHSLAQRTHEGTDESAHVRQRRPHGSLVQRDVLGKGEKGFSQFRQSEIKAVKWKSVLIEIKSN